MLDNLKKWVLSAHKLERQIKECESFKGEKGFAYKSPRLQVACNEIEKARMAAGDLVRLWILGANSRSNARFNPAEHGCISQHQFIFPNEETDIIHSLKNEIRELLYEVIEPMPNIVGPFNISEFFFYAERLKLALYDCDRALGLRLGDIYSNGK